MLAARIAVTLGVLTSSVLGLQNYSINPQTLAQLMFEGTTKPMVLASPMWESFGEVPCQYVYQEGFYNLLDVWNMNNPTLLETEAAVAPLTSDKVYFAFCQKLGTATDFAGTECNLDTFGNFYAISVSSTNTCTGLSTTSLTSIT